MPRYYVSFSFESLTPGLNIASLDVTTPAPIVTVDDLAPVYDLLARQGYTTNVKVLAFSLYANPTTNTRTAAAPHTNPAPRPQPPRRRPSPRPGRHT